MRKPLIAWLVLVSTCLPAFANAQDDRDPETFMRAYTRAWNERDVERILSFFTGDAIYEDVTVVGNGWAKPMKGREGIRQGLQEMYAAMPDMDFDWTTVRAGAGVAVLEWTMTGTHTGDWPGLPATGEQISVPGVSVVQLTGGMISHQRDYYDAYLLLSQLGSLPAQGSLPGAEAAPADDTAAEPFKENKRIARGWFEEVINRRDLDAIPRLYAADYVYHGPDGLEMRGHDQVRKFAAAILDASEDRRAVVHQQLAEGDLVTTRFSSRGHHTGTWRGTPPTGRIWITGGIVISRIVDGKIVEDWEILHQAGM